MKLLPSADLDSLLEGQFERRRFTRRTDLTDAIRLAIANAALHARENRVWGTITHLAEKYGISRPFVYFLAERLKEAGLFLFGEAIELILASSPRERAIEMMLALRLEARSSIDAISAIMSRFGYDVASAGFISETLSRIGSLLSPTLSTGDGLIRYLVFASDEIFSKTTPILVTVDPCSSAILRIELADSRKAEDWKRHFECLYDNGIEAIYLVCDEGKGLRAGQAKVMPESVWQPDTYHAIAHQLGRWAERLEAAAYKAIRVEQDGENKLMSARSDRVREKRWVAYEKAAAGADKAVALYEDFSYLYRCVLAEILLFDSNGNLRERQQAKEGVTVGLALVEELHHTKITEVVRKIERILPDLFHYFEVAEKTVQECKKLPIDEATLKAYCIAWQWGKATRKAKKVGAKRRAQEREQFCLEIAEGLHQEGSEAIQNQVYAKLDQIVQSSALVECINSIIRPYLNTTKNHVTQELLNLIMHYHNHRRYRGVVRKGKTPIEILTGKKQTQDWMSLLFDTIRQKDPELLLAS